MILSEYLRLRLSAKIWSTTCQAESVRSVGYIFGRISLQDKLTPSFYPPWPIFKQVLVQKPDGRCNRQLWKIQPKVNQPALLADDLDTYYISRAVLPGVFIKQRTESLDRMQEVIRQRVMGTRSVKYRAGLSNLTLTNSHFYENRVTTELDSTLRYILWAVGQQLILEISDLSGDATSVYPLVTLLPIKMIFHRGCFYVATLDATNQQVLVFMINHLTYRAGKPFTRTQKMVKQVEANLKVRFGVTQNVNDAIYDIRLQFSEVTGKFINEQNWHKSQNIIEKAGFNGERNYILTLRCGINRELIGWLFQWMSNVKILEPPELVELYNRQLAVMQTTVESRAEESVKYTNIFAPNGTTS